MTHNSPSGYTPNPVESRSQRDICVSVLTAAFRTTAKLWEQPNCPGLSEWMSKVCNTHTTEYPSALKRKETVILGATRRNSENIVLSEIGQFHNRESWLRLTEVLRGVQFTEMGGSLVGAGVGGGQTRGSCLMGAEFSLCKMQTFLEMDGADGCTTNAFIPSNGTLKNG